MRDLTKASLTPDPFAFTASPRPTGLELLAALAPSPDPPRLTIEQRRRELLQQPLEPTLRWMPYPSTSWSPENRDPENTFEDLLGWPSLAPSYTERPREQERVLVPARWDPYPGS